MTFAALIVALCAGAKLVLFGFIHYTEVRYAAEDPGRTKASMMVISTVPPREVSSIQPVAVDPPVNPFEGRELSSADANMQRASTVAVGAGILAAFLLVFLSTLGTLVAAGGAVPGVDRAVSACIWSLILLLFCLPWSDFTATVPVTGAFTSYEVVVQQSLQVMSGERSGALLHFEYLFAPVLVIACAIGVGFSFRAGVERGIIVTSISEFDRAIDKEISSLQENGISSRQPKVLGALYRTMGETGAPLGRDHHEPFIPNKAAAPARDTNRDDALRDLRQADPGRPLPRPI